MTTASNKLGDILALFAGIGVNGSLLGSPPGTLPSTSSFPSNLLENFGTQAGEFQFWGKFLIVFRALLGVSL